MILKAQQTEQEYASKGTGKGWQSRVGRELSFKCVPASARTLQQMYGLTGHIWGTARDTEEAPVCNLGTSVQGCRKQASFCR